MGPCLCGDPYCGSCGNPGAAAWADLMDEVMERAEPVLEAALPDGEPVLPLEAREAALVALEQFLEHHGEWLAGELAKGFGGDGPEPADLELTAGVDTRNHPNW